MNVSQVEFQVMKEEIVKDLVAYRMERTGCSMLKALDEVYRSRTFEKLCNPSTGLYFQASGYVYAYLEEELAAPQS